MLSFLRPRSRARCAAVPQGLLVYAVGDVHGCADLLDTLLTRILADAEARGAWDPTLLFTGDLIDRGPDSAAVVERLRRLKHERPSTRFLMGNHEEIFLAALDGEDRSLRAFCRMGGRETAISYGLSAEAYERMDHAELREALLTIVPVEHRRFLAAFEDLIVLGDYAFVHAGVHPCRALAAQRAQDLRWIRSPFLEHRGSLEKIIVHGHTVTPEVEWRPHRIGIDTGAFQTGRLTALGLQDDQRWLIQT